MNYLHDLESIININSYTKNKVGVDKVGQIFDKWFEELGFTTEIHERASIGHHRYYKSKDSNTGKKLLLLGHLDTVFPPNKFEDYTQDDKWIYGPGVCDMKGGDVIIIYALKALKTA